MKPNAHKEIADPPHAQAHAQAHAQTHAQACKGRFNLRKTALISKCFYGT